MTSVIFNRRRHRLFCVSGEIFFAPLVLGIERVEAAQACVDGKREELLARRE